VSAGEGDDRIENVFDRVALGEVRVGTGLQGELLGLDARIAAASR
jgi:hypothetical protein